MIYPVSAVTAAGGYSAIYADPPWSYDDKGSNGAADNHYVTMTLDQIKALPVASIAAKSSALFLWVTNPFLPVGLEVMASWGFQFKTVAFVWVKGKDAKEFFGMGRWSRGNTEMCLLGLRGKPTRADAGVRQIVWSVDKWEGDTLGAPVTKHSAKPPEVRDRIVKLLGDIPRCELFARTRVPGWDAWGNEVACDFDLDGRLGA